MYSADHHCTKNPYGPLKKFCAFVFNIPIYVTKHRFIYIQAVDENLSAHVLLLQKVYLPLTRPFHQ